MKASELRIGNLVDLGNRIAKVIEINHLACVVVDLEETQDTIEDYERTKPIKLTEEWLLKFGFTEKYKSVSNRWSKKNFQLNDLEDENGELTNVFWYIPHVEVKYVHQLQNLYFALTGEELILK